MLAMPKTKTKNRKATCNITKVLATIDTGTISPYPTDENVIVLRYKYSKSISDVELTTPELFLKFVSSSM